MTSINSELTRFCYIEYLNTMSNSELAYWLINSFSPTRYRDNNDVVEYACRRLYQISKTDIVTEFINRLWGMFGELPDHEPNIEYGNVVSFKCG